MIGFMIGLLVGGFAGVVTTCCFVAAKEADRQMDEEQRK